MKTSHRLTLAVWFAAIVLFAALASWAEARPRAYYAPVQQPPQPTYIVVWQPGPCGIFLWPHYVPYQPPVPQSAPQQ